MLSERTHFIFEKPPVLIGYCKYSFPYDVLNLQGSENRKTTAPEMIFKER